MTKKHYLKIIIASVFFSFLFNIFFGRIITAKISTWPILNKFKILSPQAPIVINNREVVRTEGSGDTVAAVNSIKSKISSVVYLNSSGGLSYAGSAINLTSDGNFVTEAQSFAVNSSSYYILLNDGRNAKIASKVQDPASALVFFKAEITNVPVANLGSSKNLNVGEKILFVHNSTQNFLNKATVSIVNYSQKDLAGQTLQSDYPKISFGAQAGSPLVSGEVLINNNSDIVGIWGGESIISSDNLKQAMALYFANNQKIIRPSFGFSYSLITENESKLTGLVQGALVKDVSAGSSAKISGLVSGDIISKVENTDINDDTILEEVLQKYKPGDVINLTVNRGNKIINLKLSVGDLKLN